MKRTRRDAGFALAGLICLLTAAAVATAVVIPLRVMQTRRETEQELIFRGQEYIRAIQKYQRKYGIYPSSIDDLVSRDGFRFIRRQYKDPITDEDFRLINVNADGSLTGSLTMLTLPVSNRQTNVPGAMPNGANQQGGPLQGGASPAGNNTGRPAGQSAPNTGSTGTISGAGSSMGFGGNSGVSPFTSGGGTTGSNTGRAGVNSGVGSGASSSGATLGGAFGGATLGGNVTPGSLSGLGQIGNPLGVSSPSSNSSGNRPNSGGATGGGANPSTGGAAGTTPAAGAPSAITGTGFGAPAAVQVSPGVAGVASESTRTSVMIYNEKEKYNEWEFIAPMIQTAANQGTNGPNQGGNRPNNGNRPPGQQGTTPPFGNNPVGPSGNPLGTGTTSSPFGGAPQGGGNVFGGPGGVGTGAGTGGGAGAGGARR